MAKFTPYTSDEIKQEIQRVLELIKQYSGTAPGDKIRNGNDEVVAGDILKSLREELALWRKEYEIACKQEGKEVDKKFFINVLYGN